MISALSVLASIESLKWKYEAAVKLLHASSCLHAQGLARAAWCQSQRRRPHRGNHSLPPESWLSSVHQHTALYLAGNRQYALDIILVTDEQITEMK